MIVLDTPSSGGATVRKPGDFRRHGTDGPPYIPSLTKTRQPTGNKPELIDKCIAAGIDHTGMTVPQLKAALGTEPADELYGRPSGFGDLIDDAWNLLKWRERQVLLGVAMDPSILGHLDDGVTDDATERKALDRIANDAHDRAGTDIGARRGTWVHSLTEWAEEALT